jgi:hypothetical protein
MLTSQRSLARAIAAALLLTSSVTAFGQQEIEARKAAVFVDSMGVNVHFEYAQTPYVESYTRVRGALQALGIRNIRDEINTVLIDGAFENRLLDLGGLGFRLCGLLEGGNDYPPHNTALDKEQVHDMVSMLEPYVAAVEGPDEPDDHPPVFVYDGSKYPLGAIYESQDLWAILKAYPDTSGLPVIVMSEGYAPDFRKLAKLTPPPIDYADRGNMHAYQGGGVGDSNLKGYYIPLARTLTGSGVPLWTTEMGYHDYTAYTATNQQGVSERAAAIYLPAAFLSGFRAGVARTFSYELVDEGPHCDAPENCFGLLRHDLAPKPAYTALRNMIAILQDAGDPHFKPGSLALTISTPTGDAVPGKLRYVLLQKSSGDYYLAIWNDVSVYDIATSTQPGKDLYPGSVPITLDFTNPHTFAVYAPNEGPDPIVTVTTPARSLKIKVRPDVLIVKIASNQAV